MLEDRIAPAVFNVNSLADLSIAGGVNPDGSIIGQGSTVTLRSAIQAANANSGAGGNTINLTLPGTYQITQLGTAGETDNLMGELSIFPITPNGNLSIVNTSGGAVTVDGGGNNRVFDINASDTTNAATAFLVTMQGFTITDGNSSPGDLAPGTGGGIRDQGNQSVTLTNMVLTNNHATADGGGIVMENTVNSSWTLTVNNSTISNNHAGDAGGGIDTDGAGTVVMNSGTVISGNTDINQGAGIYVDAIAVGTTFVGASMTMTGTVVSNNQALASGTLGPPASGGSGGGISNAGNGAITITSSTIANNFAGGTGGGFSDENAQGTLSVTNSFFVGNTATGDGGAIQEGGPSTTITNTEIKDNSSAGSGGGLFANGAVVTVGSSTFVGNTAVAGGGGIEVETTGSGSTITNSTITDNSALNNAGANGGGIDAPAAFTGGLTLLNDTINANFADNGGGIFFAGAGVGLLALQNTIVAKNTASTTGPDANNPAGTFMDSGGNLVGVSGAGSGNSGFDTTVTQTGTTTTPLDPLLGSLNGNAGPVVGALGSQSVLPTEALLAGSSAIDKGFSSALTTDERGFTRPDFSLGDPPDVGAFESNQLTGNAAFVQTLYVDLLHRQGDVTNPLDAGSWVNGLNGGTFTRQIVAFGITRSPEALGIEVDSLYLKILGRASDAGGRAGFVAFLQKGGTVEQAVLGFVTSPEFATLTGTDSGFVQALYTGLLGRSGSTGEVAGWVSLLPALGRAGVANAFLQSIEFRTDEIQELYGFPPAAVGSVASTFPNLLHRTATPTTAEINGWVNSGLDILTMEMMFAGSSEFISESSTGLFI
jgi:hypothetical protein